MSRLTLAQQLAQLESNAPKTLDPESAYSNLDSLELPERTGDEGREHYLDVGPSRLRAGLSRLNGGGGAMSELGSGGKYGGEVRGRMKIFDDDDDDEEEEEEEEQDDEEEGNGDDLDDEDEEDGEDEEEDDEGEEEDEEEEEGEGEDEPNDGEDDEAAPGPSTARTPSLLDPMASLRDSRMKDIEKGRGIKGQRAIFENLLTLRITFQKALTSSSTLPIPLPLDAAGEVESKKSEALKSLGELSERLFALRESLALPGTEKTVGKRKRVEDGEVPGEAYWLDAARDSFEMADATHPHMLPILEKWSSKIQAASLQVGKQGASKFLQSSKTGAGGVIEAIETGLESKKDSDKTLLEAEEHSYRLLLREIIESRGSSGATSSSDLYHLRREKKKKREAERGASKGRKIRYTVHEKAANFVVPIPLRGGWEEGQVDELFSSLFGGVGMEGARGSGRVAVAGVDGGESAGLAGLGGLRVF